MIHTFELKLKTRYPTILLLQDVLGDEFINTLSSQQNWHLTNPLQLPGIRKINISSLGIGIYYISIEVEPESLIREELTVDLFDCDPGNVKVLKNTLNDTLLTFHERFPILNDVWYLSRIDYARQIETPLTSLYVDLAQRAKIPYHYMNKVGKPGSMYLQSNSTRYNFYDKYDYICKQDVSESIKEQCIDIYRTEIQFRNTKAIRYLRKKYDAPLLFDLFDSDIAIDIIRNSYQKSIGVEDYYRYDRAERVINTSSLKNKTRSNLISILEFISESNSYTEAVESLYYSDLVPSAYRHNLSKFKRHIKRLKELGINPILLPNDFEIEVFPNPYKELLAI